MTSPSIPQDYVSPIAALVKAELAPQVQAIDREGAYPAAFLRKLGALGGLGAAIPAQHGGAGLGLAEQIEVMAQVGRECGSTAFLVWCQAACGWYLLRTPNDAVRERYLPPVAQGALMAGSGMSNTMKHLAGIEKMHVKAVRDGNGYVLNGSLPWVSNVGEDHLLIAAAEVPGTGYVMFAVEGGTAGLEFKACPEFAGLEGTRTLNVRFHDVRLAAADVLAHPDQFPDYIQRIKAGFVLLQTGMGIGITDACLKIIQESNLMSAHVNAFLDDQGANLADELAALKGAVHTLARQAGGRPAEGGDAPATAAPVAPVQVLKLRLRTSELALKAANSAVLHAGAKGYLMRHPAQRRLREAVFVAIVTPALKHLRKEIHRLERLAAEPALAAEQAFAAEAASVRAEMA